MSPQKKNVRANLPRLPDVNKETKSVFGFGSKSEEWKKVESKVSEYNQKYDNPSYKDASVRVSLLAARFAFTQWQNSKGGGDDWKKSRMNKSLLATQLSVALDCGDFKSDQVYGENNKQLIADMQRQRKGILFLFSNMETPEIEVSDVLLDVAFSSINIALTSASGAMDVKADAASKDMKDHFEMLSKNLDIGSMVGENLESPVVPTVQSAVAGSAQAVEGMKTVWKKIMAWIRAKVRQVIERVLGSVGAAAEFFTKAVVIASNWLLRLLNTEAAKYATAFVGSFIQMSGALIGGIGKSMEYASRYFEERALKKDGVDIRKGHPDAIVKALDVFQGLDIGSSFITAVINAGKGAAGVVASPLASTLISVISTALKCIASVCIKVWQASELKKMFKEAKDYWKNDELYNDAVKFNDWFRSYALMIPLVSACSLNFAGCSNPIYFFKMLDDGDGRPYCGESAYAAATGALYRTNKSLCEFARNQGIELTSSDPMIKNVLEVVKKAAPFNSTLTISGGGGGTLLRVAKIFKKGGRALGDE